MSVENFKKYVIIRNGLLINPICNNYRDSINRVVNDFEYLTRDLDYEDFDNGIYRKIYLIYELDINQSRFKLIQQINKECKLCTS